MYQFYSVFKVPQNAFNGEDWVIKPPSIARIQQKLETLPKLSEFMNIGQGVATGHNKVFIMPKSHIPKGEEAISLTRRSPRALPRYKWL